MFLVIQCQVTNFYLKENLVEQYTQEDESSLQSILQCLLGENILHLVMERMWCDDDNGGGSDDEIVVEEHICQTHLCSPEVLCLSVCYFPLFKLGPSLDIFMLSEVRYRQLSYDITYMRNLKQRLQMNLFTKWKQSHRCRKQIYGCWGKGREG